MSTDKSSQLFWEDTFSHGIQCTWLYNSIHDSIKLDNFMSIFLPQPFFDKILSPIFFFNYRKTQTQAGMFICDLGVFTFAVDSKNVITPLTAVWTWKVLWYFQKYFALWPFCRTQTRAILLRSILLMWTELFGVYLYASWQERVDKEMDIDLFTTVAIRFYISTAPFKSWHLIKHQRPW